MSNIPLGAATVEIRAGFARFRRDLDQAKRETGDAATRMRTSLAAVGTAARGLAVVGTAATAAAGGLLLLVQRAAKAAEEIADMADKVGVSTERLQELRFAFTQNGASIADVDTGLSRLNAGLGAFVQTGSGPAAQGLRAIGITSREAAAALGDTERAFDEIVRRLAAIPDPAQRAGAAMQIFGREAGPRLAVLIGQGGQEIENLSRRAREMGIVLRDDAVRQAAALSAQLRALAQTISTQMTAALIEAAPLVMRLTQAFADGIPVMLGWIAAIERAFGRDLERRMGARVLELRAVQEQIRAGVEAQATQNPAQMQARDLRTVMRLNELREREAVLLRELNELETQRERINEPLSVPGVTLPDPPALTGGSAPGVAARQTAYDELLATMREAQRANIEEMRMLTMSDEAQLERRASLEANRMVRELLTAAERDGLSVTAEMREEIYQVSTAHEMLSVELARNQRAHREAQRAAEAQAAAVQELGNNMARGIAQARTFRGALESIGRVILEAGLQGLFTGQGAFGSFGTSVFGTGGATGAIGRGLAPSAAVTNANGNAFSAGRVIPFATGGVIGGPTTFPMAGGRTGLMGEAGPEAIMPLRRGPDGRLGVEGAGSGVTVNNVYHFAPGVSPDQLRVEGERIKRETIASITAARRENRAFLA